MAQKRTRKVAPAKKAAPPKATQTETGAPETPAKKPPIRKVAPSKLKPEDLVYGNKDTKKQHAFPYEEKEYYQVKMSRQEALSSGEMVVVPAWTKFRAFRVEQWEHNKTFEVFSKQGWDIEILHNPTVEGEVTRA